MSKDTREGESKSQKAGGFGVHVINTRHEVVSVHYGTTSDGRTLATRVDVKTTSPRLYARDGFIEYRELTCERYRDCATYVNGYLTKPATDALHIVERNARLFRRLARRYPNLDMNDIPLVKSILGKSTGKL